MTDTLRARQRIALDAGDSVALEPNIADAMTAPAYALATKSKSESPVEGLILIDLKQPAHIQPGRKFALIDKDKAAALVSSKAASRLKQKKE